MNAAVTLNKTTLSQAVDRSIAIVISTVNGKGGTGKTTTVICLSHCLSLAGYKVAVIDTDRHLSITDWVAVGEHGEIEHLPKVFTAINNKALDTVLEEIRSEFDFIFIDTGANDPQMAQAAIDRSNFTFVPLNPSPLDFWAQESHQYEKLLGGQIKMREVTPGSEPFGYAYLLSNGKAKETITQFCLEQTIGEGTYIKPGAELETERDRPVMMSNRTGYKHAIGRGSSPLGLVLSGDKDKNYIDPSLEIIELMVNVFENIKPHNSSLFLEKVDDWTKQAADLKPKKNK